MKCVAILQLNFVSGDFADDTTIIKMFVSYDVNIVDFNKNTDAG